MIDSEIKIYQTDDGQTKIDVKFDNETVWLTQKQMAQLFDKDSDTIGLHLKNSYQSGELEEYATTEDSSVVQQEGILKIISQYAYALDILDQYDYQSLEIKNTSGKEIYQYGSNKASKKNLWE